MIDTDNLFEFAKSLNDAQVAAYRARDAEVARLVGHVNLLQQSLTDLQRENRALRAQLRAAGMTAQVVDPTTPGDSR